MAEVDTSSYPKPEAGKSLLDNVQQYQTLESGKLSISKQKLDQVNQGYEYLMRELKSLSDNPTADDMKTVAQNATKMKLITPDMFNEFLTQIPQDPAKIPAFRDQIATKLASTAEAINAHYGANGYLENGQQITPVRQKLRGGPVQSGLPIQQQLPPNTTATTPEGTQLLGPQPPQLPQGATPRGMPGQFSLPTGPIEPKSIQGQSSNFGGNVIAANVEPPQPNFNERFAPQGPKTSQPPMFAEGMKQLNEDQDLATARLTAIKPALQVLPLLPGMRTGPTTESFTKVVAALKANGLMPIDAKNDATVVRQIVAKKLAQYLSSSPIGQRSDAAQALAEAGSPNPSVQLIQALEKLTKDAVVQDRGQIIRPAAFEGKDYSKYGAHKSTFPAEISEKALNLDFLKPDERKTLIEEMKKNKDTVEGKKFWKTLSVADKLHLMDLPE